MPIRQLFPLLLFLFISCTEKSAKVSFSVFTPEQEKQIDSLFAQWNQPNHPGGSIGVMMGDEIVYAKAFGQASLEFNVPNTDTTLYNIASVSKQFTAYAMLLLEEQGKISLDDEIHKYFPEFKDLGHPVTIRQMIHHTSGLRSLHALMTMAGWRDQDKRTNDDLMRLMSRQEELNFKPGDEYLYCNTGYMLMAEIVERVSGQDFISWMDENVFDPVGMNNTYLEEEYDQIIPGNATSYNWYEDKDSFRYSVPYWGYVGSGNIHTNIYDLLRWLDHLNNPPTEKANMIAKMFERGILNNGDTLDYAAGLSTFQDYHGEKGFGHGGSIGGYRASIQSVPEYDLKVVVLTNFSDSNPGKKAFHIIDIILGKEVAEESREERKPTVITKLDPPAEVFGSYYSPELQTSYTLSLGEASLIRAEHPRHGFFDIWMNAPDTLKADHYAFRQAVIVRDEQGEVIGLRASNGRVRNMRFDKVGN